MIKLLEKILKCYLGEKEINNKWIINFSLLVPFFIIIIVMLILVVLGFFSYDERFYIMDFFNILDPYILNLGFLFYGGLIGYFISINSKEYIKKSTIYIVMFLSVVLVGNYFIKGLLENILYISETSLTKCLIPSISDEINISQLANFRVNESIIGSGLDINLYNSTKKLYYPKEDIKCGENNIYCKYYNIEQDRHNDLLNDYQEKCIEQNQEKLGNLSGVKIITSGLNNKYFPVIHLDIIKNQKGKLDSLKIKELNSCIDNKNGDIYKCLIDINEK